MGVPFKLRATIKVRPYILFFGGDYTNFWGNVNRGGVEEDKV